jgi:hypothetical protein
VLALRLAPAPIGDAEPPIQTCALLNTGPAPLEYALDLAPLAALAEESYTFEALRFAGGAPLKGACAGWRRALARGARPLGAIMTLLLVGKSTPYTKGQLEASAAAIARNCTPPGGSLR